MKLFKLIIPAVASLALALSSCSDSGYWEDGTKTATTNYTFQASEQKFSFVGEVPQYVTVYINRSTTSGAATVAIKADCANPEIVCPAEASFADGKAQAEYNIAINPNLECGVNNVVTLTIDGDVLDFNIPEAQITIYREFTYTSIGTGHIYSEGWEYDWDVEVERADTNPHIFRICDPYYILGSNGTGVMMITCNDDFTQATFQNFFLGAQYSGYDMYWRMAAPAEIVGNSMTFPVIYGAYSGGSYAGSFGTYAETIVMPDNWK